MDAVDVRVPDIGDFKNIPIIEILVKAGDRVTRDAPLIVLESEKATLDVPSPETGLIRELKIAVGDRVSVGSVLMTMDVVATDAPPRVALAPVEAAAVAPTAQSERGAQVVAINAARTRTRPVDDSVAFTRSPYASPSIRRISREFGIDLNVVRGSGPRGRILKDDLHQFVKATLATPAPATSMISAPANQARSVTVAHWPEIDFSKFGSIERRQLSKLRKLSGVNLTRNAIVIPHVTNFDEADITDLESFRSTLNAGNASSTGKLTILPFLIKAAAATLAKFPTFNASLDGDELVVKHYFHLGFAVDTPGGLMVPVIRDVDHKGIREIAAAAAELAEKAREGKLEAADMQGGSFTISSLGGVGGTGFTPIINAPEVAILGAARAQMRPVWRDNEFRPRMILPLSLSWDHRVVDGVAAARFLVHLTGLLSDFRRVTL
jgi:pyruvate dehydrogenase E2 component (dihydrolipoamide acetyltransferase)